MTNNQKYKLAALTGVILLAAVSMHFLWRKGSSPCRRVRDACQAAGFKYGETPEERKEFIFACFRPLIRGETIANVIISDRDLENCRDRQSRKRRRGDNQPPAEDDQ